MNDQTCPYCSSSDIRNAGSRKSQSTNQVISYRYKCSSCNRTYSVTVTALKTKADALGINTERISRVKYWETSKGEPRMSITEDFPGNTSTIDSLFTSFQDFAENLPSPIKVPTTEEITEHLSGADFLLVTTDRHFGMKVGDEALYSQPYGEYQVDDQNLHMIDSVASEAQKYGRFKNFWYVDLGDTVHGYNNKTVRGTHELSSSLSTREQFDLYLSSMWALIDTLYHYNIAEHYNVLLLVNDNHAGDFGYICARAVQTIAKIHAPDINFRIETKFMTHEYIGEEAYIFTHGKDREHMKFGMPLTLNPKTETLLDKYMMFHKLTSGHTHVLKGDIHQPATTYGRSFRYKNVIPSTGSSEREDILYGSTWRGYEYEIIKSGEILQNRTVVL